MVGIQTALAPRPAPTGANEPLSDRNFWRLCDLVYQTCGIKLTAKKRSMIDGRLRRRMRSLDIANINDYCRLLFDGNPSADLELVYFVDAVTTNKTDFFREPAHFVFLQNCVLPGWREEGRRRAKVWSAASSTGAEAYTIAMVIDDYFHDRGGFDYSILATDICTDVLENGKVALYPDHMLEPIPEEFRRRYVLIPRDPARHEFRIAGALRSKVNFQRLNLMDDRYTFDRNFDLLFLRNVLIYFDRPTQEAVLTKLCEHLRPGGYLFLGHSESLVGAKFPLDMVANTIFCRR
jgi:chemotaxis protein methyltransferase CheR